MLTISDKHTQKIKPSADPIVVATVDKCLAPCERCPAYYIDFTGRFRVNCAHSCHKNLEEQHTDRWSGVKRGICFNDKK